MSKEDTFGLYYGKNLLSFSSKEAQERALRNELEATIWALDSEIGDLKDRIDVIEKAKKLFTDKLNTLESGVRSNELTVE